jgi:hypothetical protein
MNFKEIDGKQFLGWVGKCTVYRQLDGTLELYYTSKNKGETQLHRCITPFKTVTELETVYNRTLVTPDTHTKIET